MKLSQMFDHDVVTVSPSATLAETVLRMRNKNVGAIVVVDDEKVVGIVTDRDVALSLGMGEVTPGTPVNDIMTREVLTIRDDEGVFNATQYMMGRKLRRLPVIDREDRLVGMVTADDLFGLFGRELLNVAHALEPALGERV